MRSNLGDDFDDSDFDDFDDYDEFEDLDVESALLTSELTDELVRHLAENWRVEEEGKRINVNVSLTSALSKTPTKWLDAACHANQITLRGSARRDRRAKIAALVNTLANGDDLARCVTDMPAHARAALRRVVENGGWLRLAELTRDFGGMEGDGWFWDEDPPTSSLGELRRRALLFVGKTSLTKHGRNGKRLSKVAVVPQDLRHMLRDILADVTIRREEESAIVARFATPEDLLGDALAAAHNHYEMLEWRPPIAQADVESFLRHASKDGFNPALIWFGVDTLLTFIERNLHEIQLPEHLCGYHLSELATSFVDRNYLQRWTLRERRNVIEVAWMLYAHLHELGRIGDDTYAEIRQARDRLVSGQRKLKLIHRPPPLGGELIFTRLNPNTGEEERYTYNHQRLLMAWAGAFHQDWKTLLSVCETVPGGKQKAALIHELIALDPGLCDLIVSQANEDDFDRAILWFYEERVIELSAW